MARDDSGGTRADSVQARLRADILSGRLGPGQRLKSSELCTRYGASVGVVREALARLTSQGLVRSQNHQGYTVTAISKADLSDLTTARLEIESLVLQRSVAEGDLEWEAQAISAHHVLARTALTDADGSGRMSDEWVQKHRTFHDALLAGCSNRRLLQTARSLRQEAELYQRWSLPLGASERDIPSEHQGLLDAAVTRDAPLAVERLKTHINRTAQQLTELLAIPAT